MVAVTSTIVDNFPFLVSKDRRKEKPGMNRFFERIYIHSRVQQPCKFIGTKESVYIKQELNSHRIGLVHQHVRCLVVLQRQYGFHFVVCLRSIPYSGVLFAF